MPPKRGRAASEGSKSSSSSEDDEPALRLDAPLEDEGLEDVDFEFDDPQRRHAPSLRGLLRRHPLESALGAAAADALAELVAGDSRSVGTVVGSGGGDDLVGFAAAVDLDAHAGDAHAGVDAAVARLAAVEGAAFKAKRPALLAHAFFVNTPPKVVAAAFRCLADDLSRAGLAPGVILAPVSTVDAPAPGAAKRARPAATTTFHDDELAARAAATADLGGKTTLLALRPAAFAEAVAAIGALADAS